MTVIAASRSRWLRLAQPRSRFRNEARVCFLTIRSTILKLKLRGFRQGIKVWIIVFRGSVRRLWPWGRGLRGDGSF